MRLRKTLSIILILWGFLIAIWVRFTLVAGIPFFIVGAILCFLTNWKTWLKLTLTILPVLLWLPFMLGSWYIKNKVLSQADTYIFPKGFHGQAIIAYGISSGRSVRIENGRRLFLFDTTGIIVTQATDPKGLVDQEFFFKDSAGQLTKISKYDYLQALDKKTQDSSAINIFGWHEKGTTGAQDCSYKFFNFKICSLSELDTIDKGFKSLQLHAKIKQKACRL